MTFNELKTAFIELSKEKVEAEKIHFIDATTDLSEIRRFNALSKYSIGVVFVLPLQAKTAEIMCDYLAELNKDLKYTYTIISPEINCVIITVKK